MTAVAKAITGFLRLGGTGVPYTTPVARDVVIQDLELVVGGKKISADKALSYIPFFAAVRAISEDTASLPLNVYRPIPSGGRDKDEDHPVHKLLHDQPNPYMTAFSFRETLQSHVLTWGNGYAEIEFADDGSILALWPLRPDRMLVFIDRARDALVYRYLLADGNRVDLPRRKVFHVHGLGNDGLIGYSVVEKASRALGLAINAEKLGSDTYDSGGIPPAVLRHPAELSDKARTNLRTSIDSGELSNRNRMALLEEGMDIKVLGLPPKDQVFIEAMGQTRGLMATLFRMPPVMLGDVERSTSWGTGVEQQQIGYTTFALRSWLVRWEAEGKFSLLRDEDRYLRHVVDGLLRGDVKTRWTAYNNGLDRGVWAIDDVLEMEDRNPLPDGLGKRHFVPLNMVPLDQIGEMTMEERVAVYGGLIRAGVQPESAADAADLDVEPTDLEPVTMTDLGPYMVGSNGNGNGASTNGNGRVPEVTPR